MKIAIMGAGLSGLSCAKYLENNGIYPEIFERRHRVGERFPNIEAVLSLVHREIKNDLIVYLSKNYGISFVPNAVLHTLEVAGPTCKVCLSGPVMGYTSIRGNDDRSWERQLERQVKSKIHFRSGCTWQELSKEFDRVVIATGDPDISRELGIWSTDFEAFIMGCSYSGDFQLGTAKIWLNTRYSRNCMVYSAPYDHTSASIAVVAIPSSFEELEQLWRTTAKELKIKPARGSEFKLEEFKIGRTSTNEVGNILLSGAAGGFVEPFMGFGQIPSILSGIYAAKSIITGKSYNKMCTWYKKRYSEYLRLRKWVNKLDNQGFDSLVKHMKNPILNYTLTNTRLPVFTIASKFACFMKDNSGS